MTVKDLIDYVKPKLNHLSTKDIVIAVKWAIRESYIKQLDESQLEPCLPGLHPPAWPKQLPPYVIQTTADEQAAMQNILQSRRFELKLKPHQFDAVQWMLRHEIGLILDPWTKKPTRGGILADDMGLGKTITVLATIAIHQQPRATLIVMPRSLLQQWKQRCESVHQPCIIYHFQEYAKSKSLTQEAVVQYPIVLTSYEMLRRSTWMQTYTWSRLVADEAHVVRNPSTKIFEALHQTRAGLRWAVTGTPFNNSFDDLGALMEVIGSHQIGSTSLSFWRSEEKTLRSNIKTWQKIYVMRRHKLQPGLLDPALPSKRMADVRAPFCTLEEKEVYGFYGGLLKKYANTVNLEYKDRYLVAMLRQRQISISPMLLTSRLETSINELDDAEVNDEYDNDHDHDKTKYGCGHMCYKDEATMLDKHRLKFKSVWLRLYTHPQTQIIVISFLREWIENKGVLWDDAGNKCKWTSWGNMKMPLFQNTIDVETMFHDVLSCHDVRVASSEGWVGGVSNAWWVASDGQVEWARGVKAREVSPDLRLRSDWRTGVTQSCLTFEIQPCPKCKLQAYWSATSGPKRHPTKMGLLKNWLVRHFKPVLSKSPPIKSPSDRVLIFSVWTAALQECSLVLNECNIPYVMYHGSLSAKQRDDAVRSFRDLTSPVRVMLCTYGSGGVGLDLGGWIDGHSICSRVLLLDMWFNPQIEAQAIDRVHRIYQTEPVQVTRFIMDGSMEERIVAIQNKKKRQCEFVLDLSTAQITHKDTNKQLWKELVDSLQNAYDT